MPKSKMSSNINGLTWYREQILVNTEQALLSFNSAHSGGLTRVGNISNAASVKVEWFAGKLYWSNPFERMVKKIFCNQSQLQVSLSINGREIPTKMRLTEEGEALFVRSENVSFLPTLAFLLDQLCSVPHARA